MLPKGMEDLCLSIRSGWDVLCSFPVLNNSLSIYIYFHHRGISNICQASAAFFFFLYSLTQQWEISLDRLCPVWFTISELQRWYIRSTAGQLLPCFSILKSTPHPLYHSICLTHSTGTDMIQDTWICLQPHHSISEQYWKSNLQSQGQCRDNDLKPYQGIWGNKWEVLYNSQEELCGFRCCYISNTHDNFFPL